MYRPDLTGLTADPYNRQRNTRIRDNCTKRTLEVMLIMSCARNFV